MQYLQVDYIKENLHTFKFGRKLLYFPKLGSTNDQLMQLARDQAPEGCVVVAEQQTAGRGRQGNNWYSPPGAGLYFSLLLRPQLPAIKLTGLTMALGISVAEALEKTAGIPVELKWPNDLFCRGRKLGGILTEIVAKASEVDYVLVGVGLNINNEFVPLELCETATSIRLETGKSVFREGLMVEVLTNLESDYQKFTGDGLSGFTARIQPRFYLQQRWVKIETEGNALHSGVVTGFDNQGSLLLIDESGGTLRFNSGTIAEVRE